MMTGDVPRVAAHHGAPGGRLPEVAAEYAPDALLMIDGTGAITYINAAAETLFGYGRGQLLGRHYGAVIPGRFQGHVDGVRAAFESDGGVRQMGADLASNALNASASARRPNPGSYQERHPAYSCKDSTPRTADMPSRP